MMLLMLLLFAGLWNLVMQMRKELSGLQLRVEEIGYLRSSANEAQPANVALVTDPLFQTEPENEPERAPDIGPDAPPNTRTVAKQFRTATIVRSEQPSLPETNLLNQHVVPETPNEPYSAFNSASFESLVGGKLPIWVGGIALVFAGFFLVRYTIEAGLLGPGVRSLMATIFALVMIAISEFGGRLPKVGSSFTADPRIAQSLAGAAVATLYGTLYMASEIYGLIGVPTSFVLVIAITIIAFMLSLRRGPPTALMGLAGGFAAPWVAGMGGQNMPALLLYLAVFIASLFGLALWRRWLWLLVLASGGGTIWSVWLLFQSQINTPLLGLFILASGSGAAIAVTRFDVSRSASDMTGAGSDEAANAVAAAWPDIARYAPMAAAFVQLALLLPQLSFSFTGWAFYFALSALSIALAWRHKALLPIVAGALLLSAAPLAAAWEDALAITATNILVALGLATIFGVAGHAGSRRKDDSADWWAFIGLAAPVICWFVPAFFWDHIRNQTLWYGAASIAAVPSGYMAWQRFRDPNAAFLGGYAQWVQATATAATALMACTALIGFFDKDWAVSIMALTALAIAAWAKATDVKPVRHLASIILGLTIFAIVVGSQKFISAFGASIGGQGAFFARMPNMIEAAQFTLLPTLMLLVCLWPQHFALGLRTRRLLWGAAGTGITAFIWLVAKQPFAITTQADFIRFGFAERAVFTQTLFGAGWFILFRVKMKLEHPILSAIAPSLGLALSCVAVFRLVYFDLLLLNPVAVAQYVGPAPFANLGSMHFGLSALWLWLLSKVVKPSQILPRISELFWNASLIATIVAVLITVRQLSHGSLISDSAVDTGENYLYSAGLLLVALAWLVRGIMGGTKTLRVAGLGLLTVVTLKVFLIDAATLTGLLRIVSFLGLGIALISIGWAYGRLVNLGTGSDNTAML